MKGGASYSTLRKLRKLRNQHLAHHQIGRKPVEAVEEDRIEKGSRSAMPTSARLISLLEHVVQRTALLSSDSGWRLHLLCSLGSRDGRAHGNPSGRRLALEACSARRRTVWSMPFWCRWRFSANTLRARMRCCTKTEHYAQEYLDPSINRVGPAPTLMRLALYPIEETSGTRSGRNRRAFSPMGLGNERNRLRCPLRELRPHRAATSHPTHPRRGSRSIQICSGFRRRSPTSCFLRTSSSFVASGTSLYLKGPDEAPSRLRWERFGTCGSGPS